MEREIWRTQLASITWSRLDMIKHVEPFSPLNRPYS
jgi:hypothetical protein